MIDCSDHKSDTALENIQINLNKLNLWCRQNKMSINVKTTKIMTFSTKHKLNIINNRRVILDEKPIGVIHNYKHLGLTLDPSLSFKKHLEQVEQRVSP